MNNLKAPFPQRTLPNRQPAQPNHAQRFGAAAIRPTNNVAQPKMNRPVAPPVYRPQPAPRFLQGKLVVARQGQQSAAVVQPKLANANSSQRPSAPPVYRPQQRAIVQPKMALQSRKPPVAPPVYRPGATAGVQPKMSSGNRLTPTAPPVYRPQQTNILQGKSAANPDSARQDNSPATGATNVRLTTPNVIGSTGTMASRLGDRIRQMRMRGPQYAGTALQAMMGGRASNVIQRSDDDDEYMEEENDAPAGYMDPSEYYDEHGGSDHSDMDGTVWVARVGNRPALWWCNPEEQVDDFVLTGARHSDVAGLGGDDAGFTWHHCADYGGGTCTMQQVPTDEHASWGHVGGASQAGYATGDA